MSSHTVAFTAGLIFVLFVVNSAAVAEPPKKPAKRAASSGTHDLLRIGEMAQTAADLRKAAEAFERLGNSIGSIVETTAKSLAAMSSEFDPFGYKTAFRTVGQQTQIIQQQSEMIRELQEREIKRLRSENNILRKQLDRLRPRNDLQRGSKQR